MMQRTRHTGLRAMVGSLALVATACGPMAPGNTGAGGDAGDAGAPSGDAASVARGDTSTALHDCTVFDDRSGAAAMREVHFHSPRYAPRCMSITAGQEVLFMGEMATYALQPGVAPSRAGDQGASAANPIPASATGEYVTVTFPAPGMYPFYAPTFEAGGMYGVIQVR